MNTPEPLKRCSKCGNEYPATAKFFYRCAQKKSGFCPYCKTCQAEYDRNYHAAHAEAKRAHVREQSRRYYAEHTKEIAEYHHRHYAEHAETERARGRRWRTEHRDTVNAKTLRRLARKRGLPDTFTGDQAVAALRWWGWKCAYCDVSLAQLSLFDDIKLHFDHYIPLSDTRPDNPGTTVENMLPSCAGCNLNKHTREPIEWLNCKFGSNRAKKISARIQVYFNSLAKSVKDIES